MRAQQCTAAAAPAAIAIVLAAACYAPAPQAGSPCGDSADCPASLVCSPRGRCEPPGGAASGIDAAGLDACAAMPEVCGNGIDDDCSGGDVACAANDAADGAVDVTAGGMFGGDARIATDDVTAAGCGGPGGRDLFFRVAPSAPEVYYLDTFGSTYDTAIRVYRKPCEAVGAGADAAACGERACGGGQSQLAVSLPAGESCIVVEQADAAQAPGDLALRVVRGGRDGAPLAAGAATYTGETCTAANASEPEDVACDGPGSGGRDRAYFATTCPGQALKLDADTCPEPTWDPVLYVRRVGGPQLACNDDSCGHGARITGATLSGGLLYFLILDGFTPGDCGPYSLDVDLRP